MKKLIFLFYLLFCTTTAYAQSYYLESITDVAVYTEESAVEIDTNYANNPATVNLDMNYYNITNSSTIYVSTMTTNHTSIYFSTNVVITGAFTHTGSFGVTGNLSLTGAFTHTGSFGVTGNLSLTGNLDVSGTIQAGSGNHTLTNATGLIDGGKIQDDTIDDDSIDLSTGAGLSASDMPDEDIGDISISGGSYTLDSGVVDSTALADSISITTLTISGDLTITADFSAQHGVFSSSVTVSSHCAVAGNLTVSGDTLKLAQTETSGGILYNDGTKWVNLSSGTANQYLKTGNPPSWFTLDGAGDCTKAINEIITGDWTFNNSTTTFNRVEFTADKMFKHLVGCSVYLSGDQSINTGVSTKVTWDTEDYDLGNDFDTTDSSFTVPVAGYYQVSTHLRLSDIAIDRTIIFRIYNDTTCIYQKQLYTAGTSNPCPHISRTFKFAVGDEITTQIEHSHGSARDIVSTGSWSHLTIHLLSID